MVKSHGVFTAFGGVALGLVVAGSACKPNVEGRTSLVQTSRVLAIRSTPAEAQLDQGKDVTVMLDALYVAPGEDPDPAELDWALCERPKPLAQPGPLSLSCLKPSGASIASLGNGANASAMLSREVCRVFGPSAPAPKKGEPASRPPDPDITGGYYQPVRVSFGAPDEDYAVGFTRLGACGVSGASADQSIEFAKRYRANENPALDKVVLRHAKRKEEDLESGDGASPARVSVGEEITLRAVWADCPLTASCGDGICGSKEDKSNCADDCTTPIGCTGSEPYVVFDSAQHRIESRRETMRVSWFASAGAFEHDVTGQTEEHAGTPDATNVWVAPNKRAQVKLWVVLRDDRGGVGFASYAINVE